MKVYIDDMLVKSKEARDHVAYLVKTFAILCQYKMKLNPNKRAF